MTGDGNNSRRGIVSALALVLVFGLGACATDDGTGDGAEARQGSQQTERDRVHLFNAGESREIQLSGEATEAIVDYVCHCIEKQEMVLRVAADTEGIEKLKAEQRGLELVLATPRNLQAGNSGQVLAPTRLLVPLSGKYAGTDADDRLTVFHGAPEYSRMPLPIATGRDSLMQLLATHGVE